MVLEKNAPTDWMTFDFQKKKKAKDSRLRGKKCIIKIKDAWLRKSIIEK